MFDRIEVGGLVFSTWPDSYLSDYTVSPSGLSGWFESTAGRSNGSDRQTAHGAYDLPVYRSPRAVSITGTIVSHDSPSLVAAVNRLTGLLAEGESGRFVVHEDADEFTWANVRQTGCAINRMDDRTASFQVSFVANDPRRYGRKRVYTAASDTPVSVFHYGNAFSWPAVEITGSIPSGYHIDGPDSKYFGVSRALSSPHKHLVSLSNGRLYEDGVWIFAAGNVTRIETFPVPPGGALTLKLVPVSGSGSMDVHVTDTFL